MKKSQLLLLAAFLLCAFAGCGKKTDEVRISGHLTGVEDGVILQLSRVEGGREIKNIQSDTLKEGRFKFVFIDTVTTPKPMLIMAKGEGFPPTWLDIWVRPGADIQISGNDKLLRTWKVESNVEEQKELNKYMEQTREYQIATQELIRDAYVSSKEADSKPEKSEENWEKVRMLYKKVDSLNMLIYENELRLMEKDRTYSKLWLTKLEEHSMNFRYNEGYPYGDRVKALYESMGEEYKSNDQGKILALNLYPPKIVVEGDDMADADLFNLEGSICHLSDYKGKYMLLDFWAAGCGPCIAAMPEMREISEAYADRLHVISISSDNKDTWHKISGEKNITWVNLNDMKNENGIFAYYGITGIPHYVMISPEGKVLSKWTGYGKGSLKEKVKETIG